MTPSKRNRDDEGEGLWGSDEFVEDKSPRPRSRALIMLLPFLIFMALAVLFMFALGSGDPSRLPSALIGKSAPDFALAPVSGLQVDGKSVPGFSRDDLSAGKVSVVNVWASWCGPCRDEHPLLMELRELRPDIQLFGLNYKDPAPAARRFIGTLGNPFDAIGADARGRVGLDWGVYGVPETFVIDADGTILYKLVGPISRENLESELLPAIDGAALSSQARR